MPHLCMYRVPDTLINVLLIIVIGALLIAVVTGDALITYGTCMSPFKKGGYCMHLTDCPHLVEMVDTNPDIVKASFCGLQLQNIKEKPLFCCVDVPISNQTVSASSHPIIFNTSHIPAGNVLPEPGECGISLGSRIKGGIETERDEYPWTALIKYARPYNAVALSCAGALINSRYVVSAAHCVRSSVIPPSWKIDSVRLGEWNISTNPDCRGTDNQTDCAPPYVEIKIERVIVHRRYLSDASEFDDIALLRMEHIVTYSQYIRPICLPRWPELQNKLYTGANGEVAGWGGTEIKGYSSVKLKITLKIWDPDMCVKQFASTDFPVNTSLQLCAGGVKNEDTCQGDSGAPLFIQDKLNNGKGGYFLIGVVSVGLDPCGMAGWPGIYTRVTHYIDWIIRNLES